MAFLVFSAHSSGATLELRDSAEFNFSALEMQFDVLRQCVYVTDPQGGRLLKVSLTNGLVVKEIAFTNKPAFGAMSPNGQRLYVDLLTPDFWSTRVLSRRWIWALLK